MRKSEVIDRCTDLIRQRIKELQSEIRDLSEGTESDGKSSAGDKHETSKAMSQLEQEKLCAQLAELEKQMNILVRIDPLVVPGSVVNGSLVSTNKGHLFFSVPLGKIKVEGVDLMVISLDSPLGKLMKNKMVGEEIQLNSNQFKIISIE